jgi:uncharacterized protein (TIGR02186 family)
VRGALLALALLAGAAPAVAQTQTPSLGSDFPAAVADEHITVSSDYRGSFITVFGVNPDRRGRGDVVVVLRGPSQPAAIMRKHRVLGLWINGAPVRFSDAPSFFAVLSNRPLRQIASAESIWRYGLDPAASAQLESGTGADTDPSLYRSALVRLRREQDLYQEYSGNPVAERGGFTLFPGGLFRAVVRLPANAPIAEYTAETYLFREGRLISSQHIPISVSRIGIERSIHDLATQYAFFYGLLTVMLALGFGWLAAFFFRRT